MGSHTTGVSSHGQSAVNSRSLSGQGLGNPRLHPSTRARRVRASTRKSVEGRSRVREQDCKPRCRSVPAKAAAGPASLHAVDAAVPTTGPGVRASRRSRTRRYRLSARSLGAPTTPRAPLCRGALDGEIPGTRGRAQNNKTRWRAKAGQSAREGREGAHQARQHQAEIGHEGARARGRSAQAGGRESRRREWEVTLAQSATSGSLTGHTGPGSSAARQP